MKRVKLTKLSLSNFRGQTREIEFFDSTTISGRNESGKTTTWNAFIWLLTGVDNMDRANYELYDTTLEITHKNSVPASVTGDFLIDGMPYTITRQAKRGWIRENGEIEYKLKGSDDYTFFVDGVKYTSGNYKKFIEETFAPIDKLKIMVNINQFLSKDWKECRKYLEDIVGEITEKDFKGDYSDIHVELKKYGIEGLKEHYKSMIKPLNEEKASLPIEIETLQGTLDAEEDYDAYRNELAEVSKAIADADESISGIKMRHEQNVQSRNQKIEILNKKRIELQRAKADFEFNEQKKLDLIREEIREGQKHNEYADKQMANSLRHKESIRNEIERMERSIKDQEKFLYSLRKENREIKAMVFSGDVCSYCGQPLPEDKLEEAKKRFEDNQKSQHEKIVRDGLSTKGYMETLIKKKESLTNELNAITEDFPKVDVTKLEIKLDEMAKVLPKYEDSEDYRQRISEIREMEQQVDDFEIPEEIKDVQKRKETLMNKLSELNQKLGEQKMFDRARRDIQMKQERQKTVAENLAFYEGKLNLVKAYEREKAQIVSDKVNRFFDYVHVEIQEMDKSGKMIDTCKITARKVKSGTDNDASRVMSGVDISNAFCKYYGISMPLFIDCTESINKENMPDVDWRQMIKLRVTEEPFKVEED